MTHGGYRPSSGRKRNSGRYGEPTKAMRVPLSLVSDVEALLAQHLSSAGRGSARSLYARPLYGSPYKGCLPYSEDGPKELLQIERYLLPWPDKSFFVRVPDDALKDAGIQEGDLLVCESKPPSDPTPFVIMARDYDILVRRWVEEEDGRVVLMPANPDYEPMALEESSAYKLVGIVKAVIRWV